MKKGRHWCSADCECQKETAQKDGSATMTDTWEERFDEEFVNFGVEVVSENGSHDVKNTVRVWNTNPDDFKSFIRATLIGELEAIEQQIKTIDWEDYAADGHTLLIAKADVLSLLKERIEKLGDSELKTYIKHIS